MVFSIVVPIYNVEAYIHRCVDSLLEQTFSDIEIILVDDQSPDNCPAICDEYAWKDSRVRVIHKPNGGLSDARNAGIQAARGDYIMLVDSDDYIERDACENFAKYAQQGVDIIIGDAVVEGGNCNLAHIKPTDGQAMNGVEYLKQAFRGHCSTMVAWLNIYRRDFLIDNQLLFKCGILHEDEQFTPRAFLKANTVICSGVVFYHYIIRSGSITTQVDKRKNDTDLYNTCCELEKIYQDVEDTELRNYLINSLSGKILNIFQVGRLYQYGKKYIHKDFVKRTAIFKKAKYKARLYCFSPRLYYFINYISKK